MGKDNNGKSLPKGITQLDNGSYRGSFMYHGELKAVYGKTLKECAEKLDVLRVSMRQRKRVNVPKMTVKEYADKFIGFKSKQAKKDTIDSYKRQLDIHVLPEFGTLKLSDVRRDILREWIFDIAQDKATSTVKLIWSVTSAIFSQAYSDGYIDSDPTSGIKLPKGKAKKETETFETKEQAKTFCDNLPDDICGKIMRFTMLTGLRSGEVRGLRWSDVSLSAKEIHIQRTLLNDGSVDTVKTESGNRIVPLSAEAVSILSGIRADSSIIRLGGYVFCDDNGDPITVNKLIWEVNQTVKKCGADFPHITMHSLRHYFATTCANNGMTPKVLMSIMGHSNIAITLNLYAHTSNEANKLELEKLSACF